MASECAPLRAFSRASTRPPTGWCSRSARRSRSRAGACSPTAARSGPTRAMRRRSSGSRPTDAGLHALVGSLGERTVAAATGRDSRRRDRGEVAADIRADDGRAIGAADVVRLERDGPAERASKDAEDPPPAGALLAVDVDV